MSIRMIRGMGFGVVWLAALAGTVLFAPDARADSQRYLCDQVQIVDGHGVGTGNCVSAGGGAPAMGLISGAFDITRRADSYTVHCADNGDMATGESWLPGEVNGVAAQCVPVS
ncbi:hypothetical protein [Nocardia seriolae]|uniref:hypothetical protein n=1 Tax=Nocardia seriolae TaxID=37332 RepID=UPI001269AB42|nr:hypothetical protein [Nocardia seriolae]BEK88229.1 hypothetical protein NSERKGN1266_41800 [Nocardia seriolae]